MDILWFLIIGFIAGWLAGQIMGSGGSLIGGLLFRFLGISAYGTLGTIVMAVIGAIVLIAALRTLKHA